MKSAQRSREWRRDNPERIRKYQREYNETNKELVYARLKAWRVRNPERRAFSVQKGRARQRGIVFLITLEEWISFWGDNFEGRGRKPDDLCMARFGDEGPYRLGNIYICSNGENNEGPRPLPVPEF